MSHNQNKNKNSSNYNVFYIAFLNGVGGTFIGNSFKSRRFYANIVTPVEMLSLQSWTQKEKATITHL